VPALPTVARRYGLTFLSARAGGLFPRTPASYQFRLSYPLLGCPVACGQAQAARLERWLSSVRRPVVIEIGAGTAIPSVRYFSQRVVQQFGGRLIRINPREPDVRNSHDVGLTMGAIGGLNAIAGVLGADWQL
jgi:hypothetical protein